MSLDLTSAPVAAIPVAAGVENELLKWAIFYASLGWAVFPLKGKRPFPGSRGFKEASTDEVVIRSLWQKHPNANVGIATGAVSGLVVLDVDPANGGDVTGFDLPHTVSCLTGGGGAHYYFAHPGGIIRNSAGKLGPGLDVRGDGGYVVSPPSLHESGQRYVWEASSRANDDDVPLAPLPGFMLASASDASAVAASPSSIELILEGRRNASLASLAGTMRRPGMSESAVLAALRVTNVERCRPPLPDSEVRTIARSIASLPASDPLPTGGSEPEKRLVVVGADEFAARVFPPREFLLSPFLEEKNIGLLYAMRGTGKTIVGVGIALAVSAGGRFLKWSAPKPRRVFYVDGELPQETLQKRIRDVSAATGLPITSNLRILTPDQQVGGVRMPNLAETAGQNTLCELIEAEDAALTIFDNLSTLVRSGVENEAEGWQPIQDWLILLRSRNRPSLMLHHTDKARGDQRGTSKREDVLDFSIKLARPQGYDPEQGARFEIHFSKARDFYGDAATPFEAWMRGGVWSLRDISAAAKTELARKRHNDRILALGVEIEAFLKKAGASSVNVIALGVAETNKRLIQEALQGLKTQGVADCESGPRGSQVWRLTYA